MAKNLKALSYRNYYKSDVMTILTKTEIVNRIKKRNIVIEPFFESNLGPASYDLSLGNEFRIYKKNNFEIDVKEDTDYKEYTKEVKVKDFIEMKPGDFILGITKEKITLPENICAWLGGRSRFARLGVQIHITAAFIQPGISNKQVLELYNCSPKIIKLYPGTKICQLIFEETHGKALYKGKFVKQLKV